MSVTPSGHAHHIHFITVFVVVFFAGSVHILDRSCRHSGYNCSSAQILFVENN